jgi:hypothetical protein
MIWQNVDRRVHASKDERREDNVETRRKSHIQTGGPVWGSSWLDCVEENDSSKLSVAAGWKPRTTYVGQSFWGVQDP